MANYFFIVMFSLSIKKNWQEKTEITSPSKQAKEDNKTKFQFLETSLVMFRFVYQESQTF